MNTIFYLADNLIQLNGPVDSSSGAAVTDSGTVKARLYDENKETRTEALVTRAVSSGVSSSDFVLAPLFSPEPTGNGDVARAYLDDGSVKEGAIIKNVDTGYQKLIFGSTLGAGVSAGNRVEIRTTATSATLIVIPRNTSLQIGDTIDFSATPSTHQRTITQIQRLVATEDAENVLATPSANHAEYDVVTLDSATASALPAGSPIRVYLGADITLTSFGTFPTSSPVAGDTSWGYRGTIADDHVGLKPGQKVRVEIVGDFGAGIKSVSAVTATVMEKTT